VTGRLYEQAVASAAARAADAHLIELTLGPDVPVRPVEDIIADMLRTDPLPCRGRNSEGREIAFEWSFDRDDIPAIAAKAQEHVTLAFGEI
jgi:hypothetical protein